MMRRIMILSGAVLACSAALPGAASAQLRHPGYVAPLRVPASVAFDLYKKQMIALREEALDLQAADGGALTPEHRQRIQRRINHIEYIFHRRLEDRDPGRL